MPPQPNAIRLFSYEGDEPGVIVSVSGIPTKETDEIQTVRVWMDNGFRHVVEIEKAKLISEEEITGL